MNEFIKIIISLVPVILFLIGLIVLDSFKLIRPRLVLLLLIAGCLAALLSFFLNTYLSDNLIYNHRLFVRYVSPLIEETAKAVCVALLIRFHKIGFYVDAAIYGFAVGAGFAFAENVYYLQALHTPNPLVWLVRGLGTAVMHGGTTAIFTIIAKSGLDRAPNRTFRPYIWGWIAAVGLHAFFNHFILPPVILTLMQLIILPPAFYLIYRRSEFMLREWLEIGMDVDVWLLEEMNAGRFSNTKYGRYLHTLKNKFPATLVADMLCYLRLHLELAVRAKGLLLMREAGFLPALDEDVKEKITEMRYLERQFGKTGKLALAPLIRSSAQELWQLYLINK